MSDPLLLTIAEAAETLRCGRTKVLELIRQGALVKPPTRFGRQTVVYAESVFNVLEKGYDPPAKATPKKRIRRDGYEERLASARAAWPE